MQMANEQTNYYIRLIFDCLSPNTVNPPLPNHDFQRIQCLFILLYVCPKSREDKVSHYFSGENFYYIMKWCAK